MTIIVATVAVIVMAASQDAVERVVVAAEERAVTNALNLVQDNVRGRYRTLLLQKVDTIQASKQQLRDFSAVIVSTLDGFAAMPGQGLATEDEARAMAQAWLRSVVPVAGEALVAFSPDDEVLVDTRQGFFNRRLDMVSDFKGRPLAAAARDEATRYGESLLTFRLSDDEATGAKYGHFFLYRPWNWVVGTIADLGQVQARIDAQVAQLRGELAATLPDVRMAGGGTVFAFRGSGAFIVPPQGPAAKAVTPEALTALQEGRAPVVLTAAGGEVFEARAAHVKGLDWYVASIISRDALKEPAEALLGRQAVIFVVTLGLGLLVAFLLAHHLAQPLNRLALHAKTLPERDFSGERQDPVDVSALPVHRTDEIGRLAEAFVFMEGALHRNVRSLMEATAARERIEGELNVAHDIQMGLLPKVFPAFPNRPEIELFSTLTPAKEVGGDLFDYYFLDDEHLCFTIGDVAGKGIPAALFMAIAKTLIKVAAEKDREPGAMACRVNDDLSRDNPNTIFVTLVIGVLNVRSGEIRYANMGHNPPMLLRQDGGIEVARAISGPAAGVMDGLDYGALAMTLRPGDTLFLYTDGVTEAMTPDHVLYGEDRLRHVLQEDKGAGGTEALVEAVMADVRRHADGAEQSDDITILAIKYRGPEGGGRGAKSS